MSWPGWSSCFIAGWRARANSCWSIVSNSQPRMATNSTNQWYEVSRDWPASGTRAGSAGFLSGGGVGEKASSCMMVRRARPFRGRNAGDLRYTRRGGRTPAFLQDCGTPGNRPPSVICSRGPADPALGPTHARPPTALLPPQVPGLRRRPHLRRRHRLRRRTRRAAGRQPRLRPAAPPGPQAPRRRHHRLSAAVARVPHRRPLPPRLHPRRPAARAQALRRTRCTSIRRRTTTCRATSAETSASASPAPSPTP